MLLVFVWPVADWPMVGTGWAFASNSFKPACSVDGLNMTIFYAMRIYLETKATTTNLGGEVTENKRNFEVILFDRLYWEYWNTTI